MTTLLMAIGFSVDFVAHITWHYYKGEFHSKRARIRHALAGIAWPMFQAGTSTMLAISVLTMVHAYMVQVFVKVVVLVIFLGMFHGLVVLPVVFAALPFSKTSGPQKKKVAPLEFGGAGPIPQKEELKDVIECEKIDKEKSTEQAMPEKTTRNAERA